MGDINIFNINMKLSVLCEGDNILIILKNNDNFKIQIVEIKKLIKQFFQLNDFFNNLNLINIFYLVNE